MSRRRKTDSTKQTTLEYSVVDETPNGNKTFPFGLLRDVRHYLDLTGVLSYVRGLKRDSEGAIRLDLILLALMVNSLCGRNSMDSCAEWLKDPFVRRMFGFRARDSVLQKTIERGVVILGRNREGILEALWKGVTEHFEVDDYDVAVDGSAVVLYGPKCRMGALGHPRDGREGELQVEFTVAVLIKLGIPVYVRPFNGNASDEEQYREAIPEIMSLVEGKGITALDAYKQHGMELGALVTLAKAGVTIIADNGAASKENMDRAEKLGANMLTRTKMNKSDDAVIEGGLGGFTEVPGTGTMCCERPFPSSRTGKTNYLFYSQKLYEAALKKAVNSITRGLKLYRYMLEHGVVTSKVVKVRRVLGVDVEYKVTLSDIDVDSFDDARILEEARKKIGRRAGYFKLTSTVRMSPREALLRYRRRGVVEQTISSLKQITGIKPLRVWNEESVSGSMVLALLTEAVMAMTRYCVGKRFRHADRRSRGGAESFLPSTEMISRELGHLTLVGFEDADGRQTTILSNWTDLTKAIFEDIRAREAPEWGSSKIPA